jgi:hypothetical protein
MQNVAPEQVGVMKLLKWGIFLGIPFTGMFPAVGDRQAVVLNWATMSVFQMGLTYAFMSNLGKRIVPDVLPGSHMERFLEVKKVADQKEAEEKEKQAS